MSLDIYLTGESKQVPCRCDCCGNEHERTVAEELYSSNITHNLNRMAGAVGIYEYCWRPEELGITKARQLIEPLAKAIATLAADPDKYKAYDSPNGWGKYEHFLPWLREYHAACTNHPEADVRASS